MIKKYVPTIGGSPEEGPTCQHTWHFFSPILILQLNVQTPYELDKGNVFFLKQAKLLKEKKKYQH